MTKKKQNIQKRTRDDKRSASPDRIKELIEIYKIREGMGKSAFPRTEEIDPNEEEMAPIIVHNPRKGKRFIK